MLYNEHVLSFGPLLMDIDAVAIAFCKMRCWFDLGCEYMFKLELLLDLILILALPTAAHLFCRQHHPQRPLDGR